MINEKKIEEAARKYAFNKYDSTDDEVEDTYTEELQMAFEAGINWFLGNLLHKKEELPGETTNVLVKLKNGEIYSSYRIGDSFYITNAEDGYEICVGINEVTRWLYLDDLLKEEGV